MNTAPNVSVIIPTHNRGPTLRRTIDSLTFQNYSASQFEVIVVADGCSDNTASMLRELKTPFAMTVLEQNGSGAAMARNSGAAQAKGRLLLFLDDDVEATSALVEAHAAAHQIRPQQVVIGYLPPQFEEAIDFFRIGLRCWWEEQFFEMSRPEHRFTYRDLLSGNFSLEADLFRGVGGFNPEFRCREDYELGYRLIKGNAQFTYAPEAKGFHFDASTLDRACHRALSEGSADVEIGQRHPELRASLLFHRMDNLQSRWQKLLFHLAFHHQRLGNWVSGFFIRRLAVLEKLRRRHRWREIANRMRHYWYWCGVARRIGSRSALANFLQTCPIYPRGREVEIDLREGLKRAEREIDQARPNALLLRYGETFIGTIPHEAGAEPLRGVHLRSILSERFTRPLLAALALEQAIALAPSIEPTPAYAH